MFLVLHFLSAGKITEREMALNPPLLALWPVLIVLFLSVPSVFFILPTWFRLAYGALTIMFPMN